MTGTPQLTLTTGSPATTTVNYASGTGTNTLTFNYTVAAGNTSADLDYAATGSLSLNGGTIRDAATNNATLTLAAPGAAGSLGANKAIVIDTTPPTVLSITKGTDPTNAASVSWTITFSESVTGGATGNFSVTPVGLGGTPAVTGISGSGSTRTVTASTGSGSGTLRLNLANGTGITDTATNPLGGTIPFNGDTYTIDRTPPTVTINQKNVAPVQADPTNTQPIVYRAVFSESVNTFTGSGVLLAGTAGGLGGATKTVSQVSATTYDISVSGLTADGTVIASLSGGATTDLAGNTSAASTSTDNTVTLDTTAPTKTTVEFFDTGSPNGKIDQIKVTFDQSLNTSYTAGTGPWALVGGPAGVSINSVAIGGPSNTQAILTLNEGSGFDTLAAGMTLDLATSANGVRDAAGNQSSFAATAVADKAGPAPVTVTDTDGTTDGLMQANDTLHRHIQ